LFKSSFLIFPNSKSLSNPWRNPKAKTTESSTRVTYHRPKPSFSAPVFVPQTPNFQTITTTSSIHRASTANHVVVIGPKATHFAMSPFAAIIVRRLARYLLGQWPC
ncbi:Hypothetical predicted protein, partial [Prunus dulcis]